MIPRRTRGRSCARQARARASDGHVPSRRLWRTEKLGKDDLATCRCCGCRSGNVLSCESGPSGPHRGREEESRSRRVRRRQHDRLRHSAPISCSPMPHAFETEDIDRRLAPRRIPCRPPEGPSSLCTSARPTSRSCASCAEKLGMGKIYGDGMSDQASFLTRGATTRRPTRRPGVSDHERFASGVSGPQLRFMTGTPVVTPAPTYGPSAGTRLKYYIEKPDPAQQLRPGGRTTTRRLPYYEHANQAYLGQPAARESTRSWAAASTTSTTCTPSVACDAGVSARTRARAHAARSTRADAAARGIAQGDLRPRVSTTAAMRCVEAPGDRGYQARRRFHPAWLPGCPVRRGPYAGPHERRA